MWVAHISDSEFVDELVVDPTRSADLVMDGA